MIRIMAALVKKAAELYLVVAVLATSLLAEDETYTVALIANISNADVASTIATSAWTTQYRTHNVSAPSQATVEDHQHQHQHQYQRSTAAPTTAAAFVTETVRHSVARNYPLPHFHRPESRWGPFFEEGPEPYNITARVGSAVNLDCRIGLLQDKTVTWLHHKEDSIHLLTVGRQQYSSDDRISLNFRYPNNYRLKITYVTRRDEGLYECQVATHPPKVKRIFLKVTAPEVRIADESGRQVTERYYKAGSGLELSCTAKQVGESNEESPISWRHGERVLTKGISTNLSVSTDSASSTLTVAPLQKIHSGNYTCGVGSLAAATVTVHVLNGELPAAVHHGNAASAGGSCLQLLLSVACITMWRLR